ncbi:recombinase family protein [Haladaptatus cibarius]|uniref:recombinase family protein n=1 Tax=Haladaptatus cibarius TaxID=453847 RepID=UPI0006789E76|nr:recombinase family protein [Haladaptatus cibarius]
MDNPFPERTNTATSTGSDSEEKGKLRAAIYARTSSNSQRFGYSIGEQIQRCWTFCEDAGWVVIFVFTDEAESGRDTERPKFQSMLDRAQDGLFDVVVFWKLDRFCRSLTDLVRVEEEFDKLDVALHSVTEFLDTTNPVGRFNFRNLASAAELESDLTSQRVRLGMYGLARDHKWPNDYPPLGYQKTVDGTLVVDEDERELVRLVFRLYTKEQSMPQVAFLLNEQKLTTKRGETWCRQSVGKVLRNDLYVGRYRIAGFEEYVEEYQIIPDELFEEVTSTRHRFKCANKQMDSMRKQSKAERILSEYRSFHNGEHQ